MEEICNKCFNLPCKRSDERRIRNLPICKEEEKYNKKDAQESEMD